MSHAVKQSTLVAVAVLFAATAVASERGDTNQRSEAVRAFIADVVGGIETLQIPDDISQIPQPTDVNGDLRPEFILTQEKADLGKLLFHDPATTMVSVLPETERTGSCATCHFAEAGFRAGQAQSIGVGGVGFLDELGRPRRRPIPSLLAIDVGPTPDVTTDAVDNPSIVSPTINMTAYFDELLWDGAFSLLGPQELPPLELQVRGAFGAHRIDADYIRTIEGYEPLFRAAFPELDDQPTELLIDLFQMVRAIAAYERTVVSNHSRWDAFLAGDNSALTLSELNGAELFFGVANCVACHTGPALGSSTYHALGVAEHPGRPDGDRNTGRFAVTFNPDDMYNFRTMGVRNLKGAGPFFHGGSAETLEDVIRYKNAAIPDQDTPTLSPLFVPLGLTESEIMDLTAFVADALYDPDMDRFTPDELPSGQCIPNDDQVSRYDVGCDTYGDFDLDGDSDLADFAILQLCFTGPDAMRTEECEPIDRDGDEDVDLEDFGAFGAISD
jgi:cytochrome c peroxidase